MLLTLTPSGEQQHKAREKVHGNTLVESRRVIPGPTCTIAMGSRNYGGTRTTTGVLSGTLEFAAVGVLHRLGTIFRVGRESRDLANHHSITKFRYCYRRVMVQFIGRADVLSRVAYEPNQWHLCRLCFDESTLGSSVGLRSAVDACL